MSTSTYLCYLQIFTQTQRERIITSNGIAHAPSNGMGIITYTWMRSSIYYPHINEKNQYAGLDLSLWAGTCHSMVALWASYSYSPCPNTLPIMILLCTLQADIFDRKSCIQIPYTNHWAKYTGLLYTWDWLTEVIDWHLESIFYIRNTELRMDIHVQNSWDPEDYKCGLWFMFVISIVDKGKGHGQQGAVNRQVVKGTHSNHKIIFFL